MMNQTVKVCSAKSYMLSTLVHYFNPPFPVPVQDPPECGHSAGGAGQLSEHQGAQDIRLERDGRAVQEPGHQHQGQQLGPDRQQEVPAIANQRPPVTKSDQSGNN